MIPKGKLLALLLAFTAVGGLAATGAFTTVQADRTADVQAVGDANALLQLVPASNTEFASNTTDGQVELDFQDPEGSSGVNLDAETLDDNVINITNNGNDDVTVFATAETANSSELAFYVNDREVTNTNDGTQLSENVSEFPSNLGDGNRYAINNQSNGVVLTPGDTVSVGLYLSTDNPSITNATDQQQLFAGTDPVTITATSNSTTGSTGALSDA